MMIMKLMKMSRFSRCIPSQTSANQQSVKLWNDRKKTTQIRLEQYYFDVRFSSTLTVSPVDISDILSKSKQ